MGTKPVGAPQFKGTWPERMDCLFTCGVDFRGKSVLDVGCNMGIVGYEVCKQEPRFYHGVEILEPHWAVAVSIFQAVPVSSEIVHADITEERGFLRKRYDVGLFLAVHHHMVRVAGRRYAEEATLDVLGRCSEVVFRGPDINEFSALASIQGLHPVGTFQHPNLYSLRYFRKS